VSDRFAADDVAKQLDYCTFCPKMCRHACPVSTASGRETFIPQAKMDRLNWLRRDRLPWTAENADPLWACTGCRHCTVYCDHGNEPGLVLLAGRASAVARGAGHPALAGYGDRFRARDERLTARATEMFTGARFAEEGDVGFWPGCDAIDKGASDVAAALAMFERLALDVPLVEAPQACGGYPLLAAGYPDLFRWHAAKVATALRRFRTVVINCSACRYTMRAQYAGEGIAMPTEILSLAEYLARAKIPPAATRRAVYYHDPCHHARYAGIVEEPRRVLEQVADVRELAWCKGDTECCGGAGMLPKTMPAVADQMARRRLAEVAAHGGGTVVTSCATCTFMLRRNAPAGVEVQDLPTALATLTGTAFTPPAQTADEA
jgi:fumarate reductase (CoM/CoB) subunit B